MLCVLEGVICRGSWVTSDTSTWTYGSHLYLKVNKLVWVQREDRLLFILPAMHTHKEVFLLKSGMSCTVNSAQLSGYAAQKPNSVQPFEHGAQHRVPCCSLPCTQLRTAASVLAHTHSHSAQRQHGMRVSWIHRALQSRKKSSCVERLQASRSRHQSPA